MRTASAEAANILTVYAKGTDLSFEIEKSQKISVEDSFGLKVVGATKQRSTPKYDSPIPIECVKAGTKILCGKEIITPCNLYSGDIWYPASGKVEKHNRKIVLKGTEDVTVDASNNKQYLWEIDTNAVANNTSDKCTIAHYRFGAAYNGFYLNDWSSWVGAGHSLNFGREFAPQIVGKEAWQAYIKGLYDSGTPATVVYKLATPIIEQYEPMKIFLEKDNPHISQQPLELSAQLSATLRKV